MNSFFGPVTTFVSVSLALFAIYGAILYAFRHRALQAIARLPIEKRKIFHATSLRLVGVIRISLWLAPIYVIIVPYILFTYLDIDFLQTVVLFALIYLNLLEIFFYRKWLANALASMDNPPSEKLAA